MKTLMLCGYRNSDESEIAIGLPNDDAKATLLNMRVAQLRAVGHEVICVLAGPSSEAQLLHCREMQNCELAFSTELPMTLLSNVRAGLEACPNEPCFVHPVEVPVAPIEVWRFLLNEYGKLGFGTPISILRTAGGAPWHFGFPLLVTRAGNKAIQTINDLSSLHDARLNYSALPFTHEANLAPVAKLL